MEFKKHKNEFKKHKNRYRSIMTVNIFLNDYFEGRETDFFFENTENLILSTKPKQGNVGIFDGQILHSENKVINGCKYLLRTDVMKSY